MMARPDIEGIRAAVVTFDAPDSPDHLWRDARHTLVSAVTGLLAYIAELEDLLREAHGYLPACTGIEEDIAALNLEQPATPASEQP